MVPVGKECERTGKELGQCSRRQAFELLTSLPRCGWCQSGWEAGGECRADTYVTEQQATSLS